MCVCTCVAKNLRYTIYAYAYTQIHVPILQIFITLQTAGCHGNKNKDDNNYDDDGIER